MFGRVLVANRGEIAKRIIYTLNKMGIESVAIYSTADKEASYVKEATKSICIGPPKALESYLHEDNILQAALQTDAEAIHPGYGFLAENARFANRCLNQKLQFIGPKGSLIDLMGDKAKARSTFKALGIKVIEGSEGIVKDADEALAIAQKIGFPVLLKARSGGGGKGMRLIHKKEELKDKYKEASFEALSSFNDEYLYVEQFIPNGRHIEFQMLADSYGNAIYLGERECSIQRNNQKLLEEALANNFPSNLRKKIGEQLSLALAKLGYVSAGTVEFLLDQNNQLYFMEMNTRIQVEHPVTELISGVDIVEQQIRIAANEELSLKQDDLQFKGHAIEFRINAEDYMNNFIKNPGLISNFAAPLSSFNGPIRIDTHIDKTYKVPAFYDSMLAKIIVWGPSRNEAIMLAKETLNKVKIDGIKTTLGFHKDILNNEKFLSGTYDCSFVPSFLRDQNK